MKKGNLSINSENILPIIKKWLYSDSDIFIRELVSNGCDAINKLKKLSTMVYPCGEGCGYAGGIVSAGVDGIKCAEAIINSL